MLLKYNTPEMFENNLINLYCRYVFLISIINIFHLLSTL